MPVVSKGEFTVSRLDDGVSSRLHVGWLMADGTFSNVYPGENLWIRSTSVGGYLTTNGLVASPDVLNRVSDYIPVVAGKKYTYQTDVVISRTTAQSWNGWCFYDANKVLVGARQVQMGSTVPVGTPVHTEYTITVPTGAAYIRIGSRYLEDGVAKFESGAMPTIYTPAPSDDYAAAYPKYRGEYTDTIEADSTDPNRYTWTAYLGEQGPPTGVISQNTVPASPYVGMLWQCTGNIAGYINPATYRWNGSAWEIYQFTAQNIMAETFTGFTFQGVEFIGSRFVSEFDIPLGSGTTAHSQGTTTIADGKIVTDTVQYYPDTGGILQASYDQHLEYSPQNGMYMSLKDRRSDIAQEAQLTPEGLRIKTEVAEAVLSVDTIYSLVRPARRNTAPANDANRKDVVVNYFRVGNLVNVAIKFELLKDTGWVALAPAPPTGYAPASMYQASGVAGSISYRGQTCMVYCNTDGLRLIPTTGQGTGVFQLSLTWTTTDPFPYGDS